MTSISSYRIYKAKCCNSEVKVANYASSNSSTVFTEPICECKKTSSIVDLEFIRIEIPKAYQRGDVGVDNYQIPSFLIKDK